MQKTNILPLRIISLQIHWAATATVVRLARLGSAHRLAWGGGGESGTREAKAGLGAVEEPGGGCYHLGIGDQGSGETDEGEEDTAQLNIKSYSKIAALRPFFLTANADRRAVSFTFS